MNRYVLNLENIDQTQVAIVGGKAAHLGELSRIERIHVPAGFCVTTNAFERIILSAQPIDASLDQLARLKSDDRQTICTLSADVRRTIESIVIPDEVKTAITAQLDRLGAQRAYAVRSSATAEDSLTSSFAGQHDTFLNVVGTAAILQHISRCWASLFTERAVTYRLRNGFDQLKVQMAVVVQQMIFPQSSGIMFTADPISGNRKITSIDASFGLGETLVSGLVNPDVFKVRNREVLSCKIGTKTLVRRASPDGGTEELPVEPEQRLQPTLTDAQVVRLAALGQQIETHFGLPQDIEWCLMDDEFQIVQSRPITTLFPLPEIADAENHVYISVGHQQMMTDAMKPLGLSMWQLTTPKPMAEAGGRLFVDVTQTLASAGSRAVLLDLMGKSDPLVTDAIQNILDRDFIRLIPNDNQLAVSSDLGRAVTAPAALEADPAIVAALIKGNEKSVAALQRDIQGKSGTVLLDFILDDINELKRLLFDPESHRVFMSAIEATRGLNEQLELWLGEKNAADTLTQSVPNNITSQMGLALLEVADVIRPYAVVVDFLEQVTSEDFLDELPKLAGGHQAREAIQSWLAKYGMRGTGEIDITRPRWTERPTLLIPLILGNIKNFELGAAERRLEEGLLNASRKEQDVLDRVRLLGDGEQKSQEIKRMIDRVRTFIGYREYPKYGMVSRYMTYKQALLEEADRLVEDRVLDAREDIFYLRFHELQHVVRTNRVEMEFIRQRKNVFNSYQALRPPRVLTSDGEMINGSYRHSDSPAGALVGLAVSAGVIEGRARVILDMAKADLEPGDILVTAYTDPSWTPLFVAINGLVTEVGGLMTHGAVIAREYGLPAIVGVADATRLIQDGQRIRVNGTDGYVEVIG